MARISGMNCRTFVLFWRIITHKLPWDKPPAITLLVLTLRRMLNKGSSLLYYLKNSTASHSILSGVRAYLCGCGSRWNLRHVHYICPHNNWYVFRSGLKELQRRLLHVIFQGEQQQVKLVNSLTVQLYKLYCPSRWQCLTGLTPDGSNPHLCLSKLSHKAG